MPQIRWFKSVALAFAVVAAAVIVFFLWYWFSALRLHEQRAEDIARISRMEVVLREKYCVVKPYPTDIIRRFCVGKPEN